MINGTEFTQGIELISDKLGIAVTEIFSIFVGAQATVGTLLVIQMLAVVVIAYVSFNRIFKWLTGYSTYVEAEMDEEMYDTNENMVLAGVCAVAISLCAAILLTIVKIGILKIMCPEYSAIIEIISIVK